MSPLDNDIKHDLLLVLVHMPWWKDRNRDEAAIADIARDAFIDGRYDDARRIAQELRLLFVSRLDVANAHAADAQIRNVLARRWLIETWQTPSLLY
jgi:hypothetical protein